MDEIDFLDQPEVSWHYTRVGRFAIWVASLCFAAAATHFGETWVWPEVATPLALDQLNPDADAVMTLPTATSLHAAFFSAMVMLPVATALHLFLPGYSQRIERTIDYFRF